MALWLQLHQQKGTMYWLLLWSPIVIYDRDEVLQKLSLKVKRKETTFVRIGMVSQCKGDISVLN